MMRIRSILWIGRGDELGCGVVADAPSLDVAWAADLDDALALPLGSFEGAVVDARDGVPRLAQGDIRSAVIWVGASPVPRIPAGVMRGWVVTPAPLAGVSVSFTAAGCAGHAIGARIARAAA